MGSKGGSLVTAKTRSTENILGLVNGVCYSGCSWFKMDPSISQYQLIVAQFL